jgi:ribose transport system substrate-binding protein
MTGLRRSSALAALLYPVLLVPVLAWISWSAGCTPKEGETGTTANTTGKKRIVLLTNGNSPFWDACRVGLQAAEKELDLAASGLAAIQEVNDATPQGQIDKLRQYGSQTDIVGVAVSALDANNAAIAEELRKLKAKGVHVVCVDSDVARDKFRDSRSYYLGTDNLTGGKELGTAAKHLLEARRVKEGSYAQFVGRTGAQNAMERMDGFKAAVGAAYREADRMGDDLDRSRAKENVRNAINNHADLVALVGIWSYNAPAIADVVEEKKNRDKFTIVIFDAEPIAIQRLGEGFIDAMVVQNPYRMGYDSVRLLKALVTKDDKVVKEMFPNEGKPDGDIYDTGLKVVVPEDSILTPGQFGKTTEFLKISAFKTWLAKYNLSGS